MKKYEIFVSASYMVNEHEEYNCFKEYIEANNATEAKKVLKAQLKVNGYKKISMDTPIEVK